MCQSVCGQGSGTLPTAKPVQPFLSDSTDVSAKDGQQGEEEAFIKLQKMNQILIILNGCLSVL